VNSVLNSAAPEKFWRVFEDEAKYSMVLLFKLLLATGFGWTILALL